MNEPVHPVPSPLTPAALRAFFEAASDLFALLDAGSLEVRAVNPALACVVGAPPEAIVGRHAFEFMLPEEVPALLGDVELLRETGVLPPRDRRLLTLAGTVRWLRFRATHDAGEDVFCVIATDVTAEYGEAAQRSERERGAEAVDAAGVGICDWNVRTGEMYWNASAFRLLGLEPGEAPATFATYVSRLHPLDRERVLATFAAIGPDTTAIDHTYRIVRPDGAVRWLHGPARLERDAEGLVRVLSVSIDVTAAEEARRAAAEAGERMRLAREAASLALFEYDLRTDAILWDVPDGYVGAADGPLPASGEALFAWLHPDDRAHAAASLGRLRDGDGACHCELRVVSPGGVRWMRLHAVRGDAEDAAPRIVGVAREITAERGVAEALRTSEARARLAMETAGLGLWDWDPATDAVDWDARFAGRWGPFVERPATAAEFFGRVSDDDRGRVRDAVRRALSAGEDLHETFRFREPDGTERWIVAHARRYRAPGGGMRLLGANMDVTDIKRAEEAARLSELKYRGLFTASHDPSALIDADTLEILEVNPATCELYGYAESELVGRPATVLGPVPDGYRERVARGDAYRAMRDHLRRDGTPLRVEVSVGSFSAAGRRLLIASARDLTDRERSRQALQALASGTAAVGHAFFADLTRELCRALEVDAAMVARVIPATGTARIIAGHGLLADAAGVDYALAGTPCANVVTATTCFLREGVSALFPRDRFLIDLGIEAYLGAPLRGTDGAVVGLLVVLNRRPIDERREPVRIVEIFANRAAAELERLAVEEALRASEERFRGLFEASLEAVLVFDPDTLEIVDANPACLRLYGYARGELLGQSGTVLSATPESTAATVATSEGHIARRLHRRRDGTVFPAEISLARFRAGDRRLMVAMMRDLTERERAHEALEALARGTTAVGQAFFESLVRELCRALRVDGALVGRVASEVPGTVHVLAGHGLFAGSEGSTYAVAGRPCERTLADEVCFVREGAQAAFPQDRLLAELGIDSYLGAPLRGADGRVIGMVAVLHRGAIDESLDPVRILEIFAGHAASELERLAAEEALRDSAAHYRGLFETVRDPLFIVDIATLTLADVNPAACETYGYERAAMVGADVRLVSAEPEATVAALRGVDSFTARRRHRRADGSEFTVEITTRRYVRGGRVLAATVARDVTERERSEALLKALVAGTTATGQDFFDALVRELAGALGVRGVFITMPVSGTVGRATTVAGWLAGSPGARFEYDADGTPCNRVIETGAELRVDDVRAQYPGAPVAALGARAYLGVPIRGTGGHALATLALIDDRPIVADGPTGEVIRIFAARAAAELERVAAEDALRASETRYRGLFETIRDPVFVVDVAAFTILDVNPAAASVYGHAREHLVGRPISLISAEPEETLWAVTNLPSYVATRRHRRADGSEFTAEVATRRYAGGAGALAVSVVRDVSERERAQQALREVAGWTATTGQAFFDALVRALCTALSVRGALVTVVDDSGRRARSVAAFFDGRAGGPIEFDLAGTPCECVLTRGGPFQSARVRSEMPGVPLLEQLGVDAYLGVPIRTAGGRIIGTLVVASDRLPDEALQPVEIMRLLAARAAAELERRQVEAALRESEERFRTLADAAPVMIWLSGPEGKASYVNRGWLEFRGTTLEQELGGAWHDALHPDESAAVLARLHSTTLARTPLRQDFRLRRRDGEYRWIMESAVPRYAPDGAFAGYVGTCIDITDRIAAERALRDSEAKYRTVLEAIHDGVFILQDERFVFANQALADILGASTGDLLGRHFSEVIAPERLAEWTERYRRRIGGEELPPLGEIRMRRVGADGQHVWVEVRARNTVFLGRPAVLGSVQDVTGRRHALQALRDTVSTLRATLEATADGIFVVDRDRRITAWNRRFQEFYRIPDEVLAAGDAREVPRLASQLMVDPQAYLARTEEIYARPEAVAWDTLTLAGGVILERYTQPQVRDGSIIGRVWSFRDITARVHAERQRAMTQSALDNSPEAAMFVVPMGRIVYANAAAERLLGYEQKALLGMSPLDYEVDYTPAQREALTARLRESRYVVREIEVRRRDGTVLPVEATTHYIDHGESGFFCTFLRDVTERRESQRRLRLAAAELALAEERSRKQLSRDLHDHVVQDLALIKMKVGALGRPRSHARAAIFDELRAQLDKTLREARTLMFEISPPVLYDLGLEPAVEWLAERFTRDTDIPCVLMCEAPAERLPVDTEVLLFQIVRELLANVRKHAGATRVRIACGFEGGDYAIEVADNGAGMPAADGPVRPAAERGFGLLHIRERLDLLGGRLRIESRAGTGTAVRIAVPATAAAGTAGLGAAGAA